MDILKDVPWLITNEGNKTVYETLNNPSINLSKNVPGFIYGSEFRFLMTIIPLLEELDPNSKKVGYFSKEALDLLCNKLSSKTNLFDSNYPFLQITSNDVNGAKISDPTNDPNKLFPQGQSPTDNQSIFWNFNKPTNTLSIEKAVLGLIVFYFYGVGTNTKLLEGINPTGTNNKLKLSNGSSALIYDPQNEHAFELIPQGNSLVQSLYMSTPKEFLEGNRIPHWADRDAVNREMDRLWSFSWSANSVYLKWNDANTELLKITRGGIPKKWYMNIPTSSNDLWGKEYHSERQKNDPLYLYTTDKDGNTKLKRMNWSSELYFSISKWYAEKISTDASNKLSKNIINGYSNLVNLVILEHATEGSANSFNIRYSRVLDGFKDTLFVDNAQTYGLFQNYNSVLIMRKRVLGFFTSKGTCRHLEHARDNMENQFWDEVHYLTMRNLEEPISDKDFKKELIKRTIKAFEKVSSNRNTVHIKEHFHAIHMLLTTKF